MSAATASLSPETGRRTRRADVSVVICAWSDARWPDLERAVRSVRRQTVAPLEIIVVADHNPDLARRARADLAETQVVENMGARGLAGARNAGVDAARGSIVAFLDDDAWADERWIERLADAHADPAVIGVGGWVEPVWPRQRPRWLPPEFDWVVGCSYRGLPRARAPVRNPIGANMSFRREAFERAGGFTDGIGRVAARPVGCEETEFAIRAARSTPGCRVLLEPDARVHHRVAPERTSPRYFASRCFSEGLSKAVVARHAGTRAGLSSERGYVARALSRAAARELWTAVRRRDPWAAVRIATVAAGLALTASGYATGRARMRVPSGSTTG